MANNIIFLDFDGPLFSNLCIGFHPLNKKVHLTTAFVTETLINPKVKEFTKGLTYYAGRFVTYCYMDQGAVGIINYIASKYKAKVVVSSTWAQILTKEEILKLFELNNLQVELHDNWTTQNIKDGNPLRKTTRLADVAAWLKKNPHNDYIIIDDPDSGGVFLDTYQLDKQGIDKDRVIMVDPDIGLTLQHLDNIEGVWNE
jgi:hypothetical protein